MRGGWRNGPDILSRCPFYDDNGWLPAATHAWCSTMQEFDTDAFIYEYGYSQGYQVDIQLRPGERLTRNWPNKGLHVNMTFPPVDRFEGPTQGRFEHVTVSDVPPGRARRWSVGRGSSATRRVSSTPASMPTTESRTEASAPSR
jgi:hypothetical protein